MKDKSNISQRKKQLEKYANSGKIVFTKEEDFGNMLALSPSRFLLPINSKDNSEKKRQIEISYKKKDRKDSNVDFDIVFEMHENIDEPSEQSIVLKENHLPRMLKNKDFTINSFEFFKKHIELFLKYSRQSLLNDDSTKDEFIEEYINLMDKFLR